LKSAPPEPPVFDGVVAVVGVGVPVPPVLAGAVVVAGGVAVAPPDVEGVTAAGVVLVVLVVLVVAVVPVEVPGAGVPPLGGAVRTGVDLGTW
jgi:hypothetical protein